MKDGLTSKQFVMVTLIIMLCGIAIFGRDYVQTKKENVHQNMELAIEDNESPEYVEDEQVSGSSELDGGSSELDTTTENTDDNTNTSQSSDSNTSNSNSNTNRSQNSRDTSSNVKKKKKKSKYLGRIQIPKINLNRGFVQADVSSRITRDNCVNKNVCVFSGDGSYPNKNGTHLILGAHNGPASNAYFNRIEELKVGDKAYIKYKGIRYGYKLVEVYEDAKGDEAITFHLNDSNKQLSLFTCASHGNLNIWYTVLNFKLISEEKLN